MKYESIIKFDQYNLDGVFTRWKQMVAFNRSMYKMPTEMCWSYKCESAGAPGESAGAPVESAGAPDELWP